MCGLFIIDDQDGAAAGRRCWLRRDLLNFSLHVRGVAGTTIAKVEPLPVCFRR